LNVLPVVVLGAGALLFLSRELDVLTTGEDLAAARGVDVAKVRAAIFVAASLMVAAVVASCGPIGFVGLMVPHAMRLVAGHSHARLLPASLMAGGAFLTLCDALARTAWAPLEFPVGVVTALLGGPFFLWLLLGGSAERSVLAGYDR
jgi:iron complex transport system permease protein